MPSYPDFDVDAPIRTHTDTPRVPEELLARVKAEGMRRRSRRHRRNAVFAAFGLALVAVPAIALLPGDDGDEDVTVAADSERQSTTSTPTTSARRTTTTVASPETTIADAVVVAPSTIVIDDDEVGLIPPTSVVRRPPPPAPATTAPPPTTVACRDSRDPQCGEFRWDPPPAPNQPLTAGFVDAPTTATVGQEVLFIVSWADPDATLSFANFSVTTEGGVGLGQACTQEQRYGPWTPPPPAGGSGEVEELYTFSAPGTYFVTMSLGTADCNSPYADESTVEVVVTVS